MKTVALVLAGETINVPPLSIYALENCGDDITAVGLVKDAVAQSRHILNIMATSVCARDDGLSEMNFNAARDALSHKWGRQAGFEDFTTISAALVELLNISGMKRETGDTQEGETQAAA